jgi:hypothetical protein
LAEAASVSPSLGKARQIFDVCVNVKTDSSKFAACKGGGLAVMSPPLFLAGAAKQSVFPGLGRSRPSPDLRILAAAVTQLLTKPTACLQI